MLEARSASQMAQRGGNAVGAAHLGLALAQPLAAYVTKLTGAGVSEAERAREVDGPVSPTPGAFVIWLPLFLNSIAHGAHLARDGMCDPAAVRATRWLSAAYGLNASWSLQAQLRGLGRPSVCIISAAAGSACAALVIAERAPQASAESVETANAAAPLAGWLTLATFANLEATLNETNGRPSDSRQTRRALALLAAACATAGGMALASRGNPRYAAAVAWGLGGVALRSARERRRSVAIASGLGAAAALALTLVGRRRAGASHS